MTLCIPKLLGPKVFLIFSTFDFFFVPSFKPTLPPLAFCSETFGVFFVLFANVKSSPLKALFLLSNKVCANFAPEAFVFCICLFKALLDGLPTFGLTLVIVGETLPLKI